MGYRLGIDLGTTFTAAAFIEDAGPRMLELGNRNLTMPSVIFVPDDGPLLFGETAERRSASEPERVLREFKRRIGDTVPMLVEQQSFSARFLQTELLRWVLQVANERLGGPPEHVVVTYPANWGLFKIQLMREIVAEAGVPEASLCPEPVAAAIEYAAKQRVPTGSKLAVYDLGGGTFDVAVLEKTEEGFELIGTPLGVEHLGGLDFDEAVFADAVSKLGIRELDTDDPVTARGVEALRRDCIEAKETLSSDVSTDITSLLPGSGHPVRLTRSELESLIRPALDESIRTTVRALRLAGVDSGDLHAVVLAGGSSRIPMVTELLSHHLRAPVASDTFPKHDIALGAARYALLQIPESVAAPEPAAPTESAAAVPTTPPDLASATPETPSTPGSAAHAIEPAGPSTPEISTTVPPDEPPELLSTEPARPPRRTRTRLVVAVIVICLAVGTGIVVSRLRSAPQSAGVAGQTAGDGQSTSPSDTDQEQPALKLPTSKTPLPAEQLIVPRYLKSGQPSQVWLIDVEDPSSSRRIMTVQSGSAYGLGLSPDRRTLTYIDAGSAIRAAPATGGDGRLLFVSPADCGKILHASWSSARLSEFVLECQQADSPTQLLVVDIDGTVVRRLDTGSLHPADPTISPDGASVAFWASDSAPSDGGSIYVMPVDGSSAPQRVTDGGPETDSDPAWSPDGTSLAFRRQISPAHSDDSGKKVPEDSDILVVPAAGGITRTLVTGPATDEKPAWSPDGRTVAFVSNRKADGSPAGQKDLWVVPATVGEPTAVKLPSHHYAAPTWWHR